VTLKRRERRGRDARRAMTMRVRVKFRYIEIVEIDEGSRSRASVYVGLEKLNMRAVQSSLAVMTRA
jgi:hypothetical protein